MSKILIILGISLIVLSRELQKYYENKRQINQTFNNEYFKHFHEQFEEAAMKVDLHVASDIEEMKQQLETLKQEQMLMHDNLEQLLKLNSNTQSNQVVHSAKEVINEIVSETMHTTETLIDSQKDKKTTSTFRLNEEIYEKCRAFEKLRVEGHTLDEISRTLNMEKGELLLLENLLKNIA